MAAMLMLLCSCLLSIVAGFPFFQSEIPNGGNVMHPCKANEPWPTVGHATFDMTELHTRNVFGEDWKRSGFNWTTVCRLDSDLDGLTNGEELGDPKCLWEKGKEPQFPRPRGHPGYCDSGRRQCSTNDRAIFRDCRRLHFAKRVSPESLGLSAPSVPRLPPEGGNDHPQTHLTKGRRSQLGVPFAFRPPSPTRPRFPQPHFQQPIQPSFGFARMSGFSVFGSPPSPHQVFRRPGSQGIRPGPGSGSTGQTFNRRMFIGGRRPGFIGGASPSVLGSGTRIESFGSSGTRPTFSGSVNMAGPSRVSGVMSSPRDAGFMFHSGGSRPSSAPARAGGFIDPYPNPVTMPETRGRITMSGSSPPLPESYRSRW